MSINLEIKALVKQFDLLPHPEGGFYKEVYRSNTFISAEELSPEFDGARNYCTSIYFLLTSENFSGFHRIKQDEVWHFYGGASLIVHVIDSLGNYSANRIGMDFSAGEVPQFVVPAGAWFASSVAISDNYSFVGCTVAPGFDFNDFELAERNKLVALFPQHSEIISALTRV